MKVDKTLGIISLLLLGVLIIVACFHKSPEKESKLVFRGSLAQPVYPPCPIGGGQFAALVQPYPGPKVVSGSFQIPELGMEVAHSTSIGVLVTRVYGGSHAQKGNIRAGDVIVSFGGRKIRGLPSFYNIVGSANPEAPTRLHIVRSGRGLGLNVIIGKRELDGVIIPPDAAPLHPGALPG